MVAYVQDIWRLRPFWLSLVKTDLKKRYRGSILGVGWSLLNPIAMTIVVCTVFSSMFHADPRTYGPFLLVGFACWNFFTAVTFDGCQCFFHGETYIRQHPAPLAIYPLRVALGASLHLSLALLVVLALTWIVNGLSNIAALPALVPTLAMLVILGWSMAVLTGVVNVLFQDMQHLTQILFQVLFYVTPIMYPPAMLEERHLAWLLTYNPLATMLSLLRMPLLEGVYPPAELYAQGLLITTLAAGCAGWVLAKVQRWLVFYL